MHPAIMPIVCLFGVVVVTTGGIFACKSLSKPTKPVATYHSLEVNGPNNTKQLIQIRNKTEADVSEDRKSAERAMTAGGRL